MPTRGHNQNPVASTTVHDFDSLLSLSRKNAPARIALRKPASVKSDHVKGNYPSHVVTTVKAMLTTESDSVTFTKADAVGKFTTNRKGMDATLIRNPVKASIDSDGNITKAVAGDNWSLLIKSALSAFDGSSDVFVSSVIDDSVTVTNAKVSQESALQAILADVDRANEDLEREVRMDQAVERLAYCKRAMNRLELTADQINDIAAARYADAE